MDDQSPSSIVPEDLVILKELQKTYPAISGDFLALKGINLTVQRGEFLGVFGKSGAGKTTLINMIGGIDHPTSGETWVCGYPVHNMSESSMAEWRGRHLGIIYQSFQLIPMISLIDNIMLPMDFCGLYDPLVSPGQARELLELVELEDHADKLPSAISGGQQQRVAIARALANDPSLILADEPTGRLDTLTAESILKIFEQLVCNGKTILMVTHDPSLISYFSRVVTIEDGLIAGSPVLETGVSGARP